MVKTILLVEDNTDIRENATELLEWKGYKVIAAANGKIGLQLAQEQLPDIILSDVMMPVMGGHEFFNELRKIEKTRSIPFCFITSSVEKKDIASALEKGVAGYIRKPFDEAELFDTIRNCLVTGQ